MDESRIQLAHGGGGQLTSELIEEVILPALGASCGQRPGELADAAVFEHKGRRVAFTTDSYVVQPLEFPGGDIGKLAVCGTINDLAVVGAAPKVLSLALVLGEGLDIALLRRVLVSAGKAASEAGVRIVTGDTKVVERSAADQMIVNTSGVGEMLPRAKLAFNRIKGGDCIVLSGPLGEHGLAVMIRREGLSLRSDLASDCASIFPLARALVDELGPQVRFMRDPTRGGLASTLVEISQAVGRNLEILQEMIPWNLTAAAAAEILGLDLLTVANEGKLVAVVAAPAAARAVEILRRHDMARQAAVIGIMGDKNGHPLVELVVAGGGRRIVQKPYGEELPRIC